MDSYKIKKVKINLDFYSGKDEYSDGDIENEILKFVEDDMEICDILNNDNRWPILYHLSPERRNLLEWYEFNKEATLLEIGAGCGALTGLFCEGLSKVVSVELSLRRAKIIANRNKQVNNLEVIVGNFNEIDLDEKFDYITLIGVLEYSQIFSSTTQSFLEKVKELLKPKGKLIIAIENKFGLKYWSGCKEDHTGMYFDSIEGYNHNYRINTFSKNEVSTILNKINLGKIEFYYPSPDYKLPNYIYSDSHLPQKGDLDFYLSYDDERFKLFNERLVWDQIIKDNNFPFFSNSFLIIAELE